VSHLLSLHNAMCTFPLIRSDLGMSVVLRSGDKTKMCTDKLNRLKCPLNNDFDILNSGRQIFKWEFFKCWNKLWLFSVVIFGYNIFDVVITELWQLPSNGHNMVWFNALFTSIFHVHGASKVVCYTLDTAYFARVFSVTLYNIQFCNLPSLFVLRWWQIHSSYLVSMYVTKSNWWCPT